jgi:hypothetical protein
MAVSHAGGNFPHLPKETGRRRACLPTRYAKADAKNDAWQQLFLLLFHSLTGWQDFTIELYIDGKFQW